MYVVTGPAFAGDIPGDMIQVRSRTKIGIAVVRILANGAADLPNAVQAQQGFTVMPLSAYLRAGPGYKVPPLRPLMALYESKASEDIRDHYCPVNFRIDSID